MAADSKEALGSMGNDAPLACLAQQPSISSTNTSDRCSPKSPTRQSILIREAIVMSLGVLRWSPGQSARDGRVASCKRLLLPSPILEIETLQCSQEHHQVRQRSWTVKTIDITFDKWAGAEGYMQALDDICDAATDAIDNGDQDNHPIRSSNFRRPSRCARLLMARHWTGAPPSRPQQVAITRLPSSSRPPRHGRCITCASLVGYGADGNQPISWRWSAFSSSTARASFASSCLTRRSSPTTRHRAMVAS